ncbi:putative membrane protein YphA (DoxX/SURF4 family) [Psychromicrobium silvestre]|uniref:Putative membrane protein YphA (DoxX/SURF4 family) n=1 Tax=Psychromicrobium silvestre TaxID=1645614 RepID=A0A7Y9LU76_9MICC|nr:DoxX family protein [Psychromicrobium silvestre]NYE95681.1 putative membrane protein YphA (DoxX/SURF4 family) [Psychromicrobium silvestre]
MNIVLWVIAGFLALAYLAAGIMKLSTPKPVLEARDGFGWAKDFSAGTLKFIGTSEVLAAIGLILPQLTGIAPILTPLAAVGTVIIQIGAIIAHVRHHETKSIAVNIVLLVLAAFLSIMRFAG